MTTSTISRREAAILAVMTALGALSSPAIQITRSQVDQIEQADLPLYDVSPGDEKVTDPGEYGDKNSVTRTLTIAIRAMVDATDSDDSALEPFYTFAIQQLTGNPDNLGGAVIEVEELGNSTVFRPAGRTLIGMEMHFNLIFATKRGDPTQKG